MSFAEVQQYHENERRKREEKQQQDEQQRLEKAERRRRQREEIQHLHVKYFWNTFCQAQMDAVRYNRWRRQDELESVLSLWIYEGHNDNDALKEFKQRIRQYGWEFVSYEITADDYDNDVGLLTVRPMSVHGKVANKVV